MKPPAERIAKRRADMPKAYRGIYDKAMGGASKAAAIHAFCLECVGWDRNAVKRCMSTPCPLFPYRPYQGRHDAPDDGDNGAESTNDAGGML